MKHTDDATVVRKAPPGWLNLAIGEPVLLQEAMASVYPAPAMVGHVGYPPPCGLDEARSAAATMLRASTGRNFDAKDVVITNGAKQALTVALEVARLRGCDGATATSPHWPTLRTLANETGLRWGRSIPKIAEIVVWPNNPTGMAKSCRSERPYTTNVLYRIWDAVYASPLYGFNVAKDWKPVADAVVGSMSKSFGLSGIRLGWVAFTEESDVDRAQEIMENSTSGVSTFSQEYLIEFSKRFQDNPMSFQRALDKARENIQTNRAALAELAIKYGMIDTARDGMFAWLRAPSFDLGKALNDAKILAVSGIHCGHRQAGNWRLNLAVAGLTMKLACFRLDEVLSR
jgi:aspartate/methionine/tyrosine aminotransferase